MGLLGIFLIIVGAFSLIEVFTDINLWFSITDFWPVIIIAYGLYKMFRNKKVSLSYLLVVVLGTFFLLDKLDLLTPAISSTIWAGTLVVIGIILIIQNSQKKKFRKNNQQYESHYNNQNSDKSYEDVNYRYKKDGYKKNNSSKDTNKYNFSSSNKNEENPQYSYANAYEEYIEEEDFTEIGSNLIDLSYTFKNKRIKIRSSSFSGGDITNTFGEITLDLRNVFAASKTIELYCNLYISNLELLIPSNWNYEIIGKNTESHFVDDPECTVRIFYKNILGELIVKK